MKNVIPSKLYFSALLTFLEEINRKLIVGFLLLGRSQDRLPGRCKFWSLEVDRFSGVFIGAEKVRKSLVIMTTAIHWRANRVTRKQETVFRKLTGCLRVVKYENFVPGDNNKV